MRRAGVAALILGLSSPALAADPDPWFGRDKALHFTATASLAVAGYGGAALKTADPVTRAAIGGTLGLGAGIAKELFDLAGAGDPSWRDLTWDLVGTASGVLVATTIDYLIRHATAPRE